ncbi:unnamed protein product [Acanthoscelides obtectus]|uniref:Uncharacterized protein n=1 Tax=Acanthoscelides obtectus TaxID=200917 RepID=A0A9P0Q7L6_ACAOB|nr:unnamed protein product [Acanthoscelides obtectus]CAK1676566.1 hypothetical protein AOBTE_LOCUS30822 [Acanthoscelides obtectus]
MEDVMIKKTFVNMLKKLIAEKTDMPLRDIYDLAVHWYPEGALVCPYVKMHPSMRRWRAFIYKAQEEMQKNAVQEGNERIVIWSFSIKDIIDICLIGRWKTVKS